MKPVRIVVLAVAAVCAVGLGVIVHLALTGKPTTQASAHTMVKPKPTAQVLVAHRDLKVGDRLSDADLSWQSYALEEVKPEWTTETSAPAAPAGAAAPASGAAPAAPAASTSVSAPASTGNTKQVGANGGVLQVAANAMQTMQTGGPKQPFIGAVVREPIAAGEPITARKIVRAGESGYLAVVLAAGKRAMSIPVTVDSGAGGFILPGDRVDVILSRKLDTGGPNSLFVSQTVLRNMKVLAIDQTTQTEKDAAAVIGATATLEVSGDEAETLAVSKQAGTLSLTLRSYADARAPSGRAGAAPLSSISDGARGGGGGGPSASHGVKVYRGGELSEAPVS
jgi:pilus assembly protein CpaB